MVFIANEYDYEYICKSIHTLLFLCLLVLQMAVFSIKASTLEWQGCGYQSTVIDSSLMCLLVFILYIVFMTQDDNLFRCYYLNRPEKIKREVSDNVHFIENELRNYRLILQISGGGASRKLRGSPHSLGVILHEYAIVVEIFQSGSSSG